MGWVGGLVGGILWEGGVGNGLARKPGCLPKMVWSWVTRSRAVWLMVSSDERGIVAMRCRKTGTLIERDGVFSLSERENVYRIKRNAPWPVSITFLYAYFSEPRPSKRGTSPLKFLITVHMHICTFSTQSFVRKRRLLIASCAVIAPMSCCGFNSAGKDVVDC